MPDRNVEALAVGPVFVLFIERRVQISENGLRQRYDLYISRGEQDPCLINMPESERFWDAVVPECGLQDFCQRVLRGPNKDPEVLHVAGMG